MSPQPLSRPSETARLSARADTLQHGSVWCRGSARLEARPSCLGSASAATSIHQGLHRNNKDERTVITDRLQPDTDNGLQRPTDLKGQTRTGTHPGQEHAFPSKGRIHCRRLVFSPKLILTVTRRTIHYRYYSARSIACSFRWPTTQEYAAR